MDDAVKRKNPEVDCSIRVALPVLMYPTKGTPRQTEAYDVTFEV